jgi:hypothetical protein
VPGNGTSAFGVVDFQGQQMAVAIGQPTDPMLVRAGGGDALVEGIGVAEQTAFGVAGFDTGIGIGAIKSMPVTSGC